MMKKKSPLGRFTKPHCFRFTAWQELDSRIRLRFSPNPKPSYGPARNQQRSIRPYHSHFFHIFHSKEKRFRQRYLDLIMNNKDVFPKFKRRARVIKYLRRLLFQEGSLEVRVFVLWLMGGAGDSHSECTLRNEQLAARGLRSEHRYWTLFLVEQLPVHLSPITGSWP